MHKEYENAILDITDEGIATIILHRPKALNALCGEINRDMMAAIQEILMGSDVETALKNAEDQLRFAMGL